MPGTLHFLPFSIGPLLSQIPFLRLFLILLLSKGAFYECSGFMFQELFLEGNETHIQRSSTVRATRRRGRRRRKRKKRRRRRWRRARAPFQCDLSPEQCEGNGRAELMCHYHLPLISMTIGSELTQGVMWFREKVCI